MTPHISRRVFAFLCSVLLAWLSAAVPKKADVRGEVAK